jgi:hypothetical protein
MKANNKRFKLIRRKSLPNLVLTLFIFGIFSFGVCPRANAVDGDYEIVVHGLSSHFNPYQSVGKGWNERNPGLAIRLPLDQKNLFYFQGGGYKNSYRRCTLYAGVDWVPIQKRYISIGGGVGLATGYTNYKGLPVPIGGPMLELKTSDRLSMRLRLFPPVVPKSTGAVSLEFSWSFHKRHTAKY